MRDAPYSTPREAKPGEPFVHYRPVTVCLSHYGEHEPEERDVVRIRGRWHGESADVGCYRCIAESDTYPGKVPNYDRARRNSIHWPSSDHPYPAQPDPRQDPRRFYSE